MPRISRAIFAVACVLLASMTQARAGTTGSLSGFVFDEHGKPVAGVRVRAQAPSHVGETITDATGFFSFVALSPDTYTISIEKNSYEPAAYAGVPIFADNALELKLRLSPLVETISDRGCCWHSPLLQHSITADVYTSNGIGFGGYPNPVMTEIQSMPGVYLNAGPSVVR